MEIYTDYVANQIRKTVRSEGGDKTVNEKKQKSFLHIWPFGIRSV